MFRWQLALRIALPLGALLVEGPPAALGAALIQEAGIWLSRRIGTPWPTAIWLAAYALRVAITLPTHYVSKLDNGNGALFPDDYTGDLVAEWLVRISRGDGLSIFAGHQHLLDNGYTYLLFAIYSIFGHVPLLPKLLNCGLAALSAVLIYDVARRTFRPAAAAIATLGAIVMPSMITWSIVTLKESVVLCLAALGLWTVQRLASSTGRRTADLVLLLLASAVFLADLRASTALILLLLGPIILVSRARNRPRTWQLGLAGAGLVVLLAGGLWVARSQTSSRPPMGVLEDVVLQIRHRRAQEAASARSQIRPQLDVITPEGKRSDLPDAEAASDAAPFTLVGDVIDPLGYALLAPAPWQVHSLLEIAASAEMLVWYVLLGAACFAWRAPPQQRPFVVCLIAYGIANWLVLAATEGNLGNLLRHRLMLSPTLLLLGGAGLDWLWVRAGRPWPTRWPVVLVHRPREAASARVES